MATKKNTKLSKSKSVSKSSELKNAENQLKNYQNQLRYGILFNIIGGIIALIINIFAIIKK